MFPIGRLAGSEHRFNWITAHAEYKAWTSSQTPSILHLHGNSNIPDVSEFIFKCLNEDWDARQTNKIVTYFTFEKDDGRRNATIAMLITLSTQILNECQSLHKAVRLLFDEMSHHCSWTKTDLLFLFRIILLSCETDGIVCIINSMSECDSSFVNFLEETCSLARQTERRFKVVVTSTTNNNFQSVLSGWPTINLDDHQEDSHTVNPTLASGFDIGVFKLIQQHSEFYDFGKRITEKLSECGEDRHWRRLILNQLKLSEGPLTRLAIARHLDVLPPTTPKEILFRTLAGIPLEKRQWARKVLLWTLYSFHPLSVWELSVALVLHDEFLSPESGDIDEVVCQDLTGELDKIFKGIFIVKQNEVRFSHPDARESLWKVDCSRNSAWYDLQETAQQQITEACLFYLSLPQVQRSIMTSYILTPNYRPGSTAYFSRHSLCSYAIKYWPRHYKLIPKVNHPIESALEFCRNTKTVRTWVQAYWSLQKPISQIDNVFSSPLPVLAGLGLQDLVLKLLDPNAEPNDPEDSAKALAEAARNANRETVRTLLSIGGYSQSNLEDALIAATSSCDEAILDLLISYVGQRCKDFQWPPVLMCRAAQFGLNNVINLLLSYGASLEAAITLHNLTPLHLAARHGHAEVIKTLLANKASIIARDKDGLTPLLIAAKYSRTSVLSLLLNAYADCNAIDNDESTALIFACKSGSYKVVRILLSKPECKIGHGEPPPLSIACYNGYYDCARLLLENKANREIQKIQFTDLLRHAVLNGHLKLCQLLLKCGADTNTPFKGNSILSESIDAGNVEIIKALIANGAVINAPDSNKQTALQKASMKGDKELVAYLLDHGADINHVDDNNCTSTFFAAQSGFAEIVQLLIDRGADPQYPANEGWTPLHICQVHPETAHTLLKHGVDVNKVTNEGLTALHLAACNGSFEVVKVILSYEPELEVTTSSGHSALTAAAQYGETEVIRLLLEAGANINHQTISKGFALQYAVVKNMENMLRILMEYNPEVNLIDDSGQTALHCLNSKSSVKIIKILVNGGADLNIRDAYQDTPICNAVWRSKLDVLEYLAKKAKLDIVGGQYGGPLHIACFRSRLCRVKVLVDAGADVNLLDPVEGTPIQSACCSSSNSSKEEQDSVIFYLINEANVDLRIIGGLKGCAINAACGWSGSEVVRLMLEKGTSIDIRDPMGRLAIHFAAAKSMKNFQLILDSGADVDVADKTGRTALHWASISGMASVVNRIISLSRGSVDQIDNDGWSPLLWAARGCDSSLKEISSSAQEGVIKLLLDRGADPCITTKGLDRDWSPVKVARYHGMDSRVIELLEERAKEKLHDTGGVWNEELHASRQANRINDCYCYCCLTVGTFPFHFTGILRSCKPLLVSPFTTFADASMNSPYAESNTDAIPAWDLFFATNAIHLGRLYTPHPISFWLLGPNTWQKAKQQKASRMTKARMTMR